MKERVERLEVMERLDRLRIAYLHGTPKQFQEVYERKEPIYNFNNVCYDESEWEERK